MGGRTWKYWPASGPVFLLDFAGNFAIFCALTQNKYKNPV